MKSLLSTLAVLCCVSAQAATTYETAIQALESANCNALEVTAATLAPMADKNQLETINFNLDYYQSLVGQIPANIKNHQSNAEVYKQIKKVMAKNSGNMIGKVVVDCVNKNFSFTGTPAQQKIKAEKVVAAITAIRNAVNAKAGN